MGCGSQQGLGCCGPGGDANTVYLLVPFHGFGAFECPQPGESYGFRLGAWESIFSTHGSFAKYRQRTDTVTLAGGNPIVITTTADTFGGTIRSGLTIGGTPATLCPGGWQIVSCSGTRAEIRCPAFGYSYVSELSNPTTDWLSRYQLGLQVLAGLLFPEVSVDGGTAWNLRSSAGGVDQDTLGTTNVQDFLTRPPSSSGFITPSRFPPAGNPQPLIKSFALQQLTRALPGNFNALCMSVIVLAKSRHTFSGPCFPRWLMKAVATAGHDIWQIDRFVECRTAGNIIMPLDISAEPLVQETITAETGNYPWGMMDFTPIVPSSVVSPFAPIAPYDEFPFPLLTRPPCCNPMP